MKSSFIIPYLPFLTGLAAFIITYVLIPKIIYISYKRHLCDDPELDHRKLHTRAIPTLGGAAIFVSVVFTFLVSTYALTKWAPYLIAGLTVLFFSGLKDDISVLSPVKKLLLQILASLLLLWSGDFVITNFGGVFGIHQISYWAGVLITLFTMIVVINAYNLIDGVDGLSGGIGIIAAVFFAWWFWQADMMPLAVLAIILTGSLLAFLRYNFNPASIFMGDTGSQIVGFLLAFFAVAFVSTGVTAEQNVPLHDIIPVLVLAVLIVPLYDTLRVFIIRALRGDSPFHADRLHIHHELLDMRCSEKVTCSVIYGINIAIIVLTIFLPAMNINLLFGVVILSAVVLFPTNQFKRKALRRLGIRFSSKKSAEIESTNRKEDDERKRQVLI